MIETAPLTTETWNGNITGAHRIPTGFMANQMQPRRNILDPRVPIFQLVPKPQAVNGPQPIAEILRKVLKTAYKKLFKIFAIFNKLMF